MSKELEAAAKETEMKTLLALPLYLGESHRVIRNERWITYIMALRSCGFLHFDKVLFVDNGSPGHVLDNFEKHLAQWGTDCEINRNRVHIPRRPPCCYGYWYYALGFSVLHAHIQGFDKMIHIDSDVFPLSKRICDYVNTLTSGWTAMWDSCCNFPESTFQIVGRDQFASMNRFMMRDYLEFYPEGMAETFLPLTSIEKRFVGGRYGERDGEIPADADWVGQTRNDMTIIFKEHQ